MKRKKKEQKMKNPILNKAIDEALEAALADLARSSTDTSPATKATRPEGKGKTMSTCTKISRKKSEHECINRADSVFTNSGLEHNPEEISGIIDHKLTLLAVAGAAVNADAEPCLDKIVHELEGTGVTKADIREAVKSGRFLGVRPDLAARVFEGNCADEDEQEPARAARSKGALVASAQMN
jgi:hypothetical protein